MIKDLKEEALAYHAVPRPGKIATEITKPAETADDLSLAYSPGVAAPVCEIARNPEDAYKYTGKGNLVAVISNGSAILGLGNLGPMASKPVMEGKSLLFKRFGGLNSIDIEVKADNTQEFVDTVRCIADTFGGINLEDIKAPECFEIEKELVEICDIPIMHDDQHGTAIVTVAGMLNAIDLADKKIEDVKMVCLGAGAAAISCAKLLISTGMKKENVLMLDSKGVIHSGRSDLNQYKSLFAVETHLRTLDDAIEGADIFLGLSGPNLLKPEQLKKMADHPIVFACANPDPEIKPELAKEVRPDVIIATGRSDYPNQVNNVLGFPFIFRGALDVRARGINEAMKIAAAKALGSLAKEPVPESVKAAYYGENIEFGPEYIIPKPMDPRLLGAVSSAVAKAAVETGIARTEYPKHYPLTSVADC
ncbi:NADP-dependent malic enzyme [invertebrate metagenome]|uniref:NADP-dependent malic enzyme n=1 Tax=invertebrate metagenome TaxID=1711999 RepID=A0A2H9T9A4_9ZZZZ